MRHNHATLWVGLVVALTAGRASAQDQVFNTDVIIIG
jgi:hypothetical protein